MAYTMFSTLNEFLNDFCHFSLFAQIYYVNIDFIVSFRRDAVVSVGNNRSN